MSINDETARAIQRARRRILAGESAAPPMGGAQRERSWEEPEQGDVVQTANGRLYRHIRRFETTLGEVLAERPSAGGYIVVYTDQHGNQRKCYCTSWFIWCAKAVREGGHYRRFDEEGR